MSRWHWPPSAVAPSRSWRTSPTSIARPTSSGRILEFGSIVLTRFPFTDLSADKLRPALVISRDNGRRSDVVLAFITSNTQAAGSPDTLRIEPSAANGLKVPSVVRFDKIVTLEKQIIAGKLGDADVEFLSAAGRVFYGVFGFDRP
ncbi:MAG: type II toxin-antitoxin system PemK/MazF family toxin [Rhodospirillaceae bacterium]|nr:type II toxin-antitoxin system PemK/MazF family toxin [Rhodospirillaceae bacterium]